jgi:hypothetical protein
MIQDPFVHFIGINKLRQNCGGLPGDGDQGDNHRQDGEEAKQPGEPDKLRPAPARRTEEYRT